MNTHGFRRMLALVVAVTAAFGAWSATNIDPAAKYAWSENAGWVNAYADGANGVVITSTVLSGYMWAENVGWICLGDGTPQTPPRYSNTSASDFGVNNDGSGNLSGYACGENIGWINFDTLAQGGSRVTINSTTGQFSGYAWGENIGWINMSSGYGVKKADVNAPTVSLTTPASNPTNQSPIAVVATFSETVQNFIATDVQVTNGSVSGFSGSGAIYTFNLVPAGQGAVTATINAGACTDLSGNPNVAATPLSRTYDTSRPGVTLVCTAQGLVNNMVEVTVTLTEACPDFGMSDVSTTNAAAIGFSGGGTAYSFVLDPGTDGAFSCQVAENAIHDVAGNGNTVSNAISRTYDGTPPAAALASSAPDRVNGAIVVDIALAEPCGDLAEGDIVLDNATLTGFGGGGGAYSFTLKPVAEGPFSCYVDAGTITEAATNVNVAPSNTLGRIYDIMQPTLTFASTAPDPTAASYIDVSLTLSEPCLGFVVSDLVPTNAVITQFSGAGESFTFRLVASGQGAFSCAVAGGACTDLAGNPNLPASYSCTFDNIGPTVALSSTAPDTTNAAITVNVTLNETSTDFETGDISTTNAVVSDFAGSGTAYSFTLAPSGQGGFSCAVAAGACHDAVSNASSASNTLTRTYDNVAPTVTLASSAAEPVNAAITVSATLSEPSTTFASGDVSVSNAAVSGFAGSVASYSFTLTPSAPGPFTCSVGVGAFADATGNANTAASNTISRNYDNIAPTVALASSAPNPVNGAITVTATLSETSTTFAAGDVSPTNAAVSGFTGSGTAYSFTLTPSAPGAFSCVVNAGTFTDAAGNASTAPSNTISRTYDNSVPTVTLACGAADPINTSVSVSVTLSKSSANFEAGDIVVTNALVSDFTGSGTSYTFTLTAQNQGVFSCQVPVGAFTDAAGNANTAASNTISRTFDSIAPTAALASASTSPTNTYVTVNVTLSESSATFGSGDFQCSNGAVSNFSGSGASYSFRLTAGGQGTFTCKVTAGSFTDAAGNASAADSNTVSYAFDTVSPTIMLASTAGEPVAAPITVTATLSEASVNFAASDITLTNASVGSFTGSGTAYSFTLTPLNAGAFSCSVAAGRFSDAAGNLSAVSNTLGRTYTGSAPPVVTSIARMDPSPTGMTMVNFMVTFSRDVNGVDAGDFMLFGECGTASIMSVMPMGGAAVQVTVNTNVCEGTLRLDLMDNDSIQDLALVPLGGSGAGNGDFMTGETYEIDNFAPTCTAVERHSLNPTGAASVQFRVFFSEVVTGVDTGDFGLVGSGSLAGVSIASVSADNGAERIVTINAGTGDGTLRLNLANNGTIVDGVGNSLDAAFTSGEVFTIDRSAPVAGTATSTAGAYTNSNTQLAFSWSGFSEPNSEICDYEVALGAPGNPEQYQTYVSSKCYMVNRPAMGGRVQYSINAVANQLLYIGTDLTQYGLWKSDGTVPGTAMVRQGLMYDYSATANGRLFVLANSSPVEFWVSDGTPPGTYQPKTSGMTLPDPIFGMEMPGLVSGGNLVYFPATDGATGWELWCSDGTEAGTHITKDIEPGASGGLDGRVYGWSYVFGGCAMNGEFYFGAWDSVNGEGLWKTNGTEAGTVLVKAVSISGEGMAVSNGLLFFQGWDAAHGWELWKSDGTALGTVLVSDTWLGTSSGYAAHLTDVNGLMFFAARDAYDYQLYKSNGTWAVPLGRFESLHSLTAMGGNLYFVADDGIHGYELWCSDGSSSDMVKDIRPGSDPGISTTSMAAGTSTLYFTADDGVHGAELWQTDGTEAATYMVRDIARGVTASRNADYAMMNGRLYFSATDYAVVPGWFWTPNDLWTTGPLPAAKTFLPSEFPGTFSGTYPDGQYTCTVRALNRVDLISATASVTVTVDTVAPGVASITRAAASPTGASSVSFTVMFSESVTGVDAADFSLTTSGISGAAVTGVSGSGATWTVAVGTGTGNGTIRLDLVDNDTVADLATNKLGGTGAGNGSFTTGEAYTIDKIVPSCKSIVRASANPTRAASVDLVLSFSEVITGVDAGDFVLSATGVTGASVVAVSGSGATRVVTVNTGSGNGTIRLDLSDDDSIVDTAANPLGGTGSGNGAYTVGEVYTVDKVPPTCDIITRQSGSPTSKSEIRFYAGFSEPVYNFLSGADVIVHTSGTLAYTNVTTFGGPMGYWVDIFGVTGEGTIWIEANTASDITDFAGAPLVSSVTGQVITVEHVAPVADVLSPITTSPTNANAVSFYAGFSENMTNVNDSADVVVITSGTVACADVVPWGGPMGFQVDVTGVTGDGTLAIMMNTASDMQDLAGNFLASSVTSAVVVLDHTGPGVTTNVAAIPGPTNAGTIAFTTTFTEDVQGFDAADDVTVTKTGTVNNAGVTISGGPRIFAVQATGVTGTGTIAVTPNLASDIRDLLGNPLESTLTSSSTLVDQANPTVLAIAPATQSPTNVSDVPFSVHFSEEVVNVDALSDFAVMKTGTANCSDAVVFGGPTYYVVYLTGVTGDGTLALAVKTTSDVHDLVGYGLLSSPASAAVIVDHDAPTCDLIVGDPEQSGDTIRFTVSFSEQVAYFDDIDDLGISVTGEVEYESAVISGDPQVYTVEITGVSGEGTMTLTVNTGSDVQDWAGNTLSSSVTSDPVTVKRGMPVAGGVGLLLLSGTLSLAATLCVRRRRFNK